MQDILQYVFSFFRENPVAYYYLAALAGLPPMVRIYKRAGFATHGAFLMLVPFVGYLLALAGLVFRRWPVLPAYVRKTKEEKAV